MNETKMMMLSLTSTLLFVNDDTDDTDDVDDVNDVNNYNDANDADADDADDERKKRSSIEERKESRLDTSLDRVERLVMCCFFALLARVVVGLNKTQRGCPNPTHWWGWTPYFVQWVGLG
jgi:hypothetical protein